MGRVRRSAVASSSCRVNRPCSNVAGTQFKANCRTMPLKFAASTTAGQLLASMLVSLILDPFGATASGTATTGTPLAGAPVRAAPAAVAPATVAHATAPDAGGA